MTPTDDHAHQLPPTERIEDVDVTTEMQGSFLEYAYSVIYSRALPDARDGLKPVQRRILYQMTEMGLRPDRGHVKSARVTGEVMGKLHPHGDSAIYDALVRMAQDFTLRVPLIDGHGNFGSLDDGPAAPRYTEARLAAAALALTEDLDEDVVDFVPNYDNQLMQPDVLPAAFPNLLVNGASGIAVGMATNMAPHNLIEVVGAARHLLANPDATLDDLMEYVPGPDLPAGGTIVGLAGVRDAYATGRGSFKTRAKVSVEAITARKSGLVVTELPYLVGPEKVIEKIKDGVNSKKLSGISDVTDLSDRTARPAARHRHQDRVQPGGGARAALPAHARSRTASPSTTSPSSTAARRRSVCASCSASTSTTASAWSPGGPQFRLARRQERLHLVEGLLIAIVDIDEVIQVIRTSDDTDQARTRLMDVFDLSTLQADYILELRLRRLTRFSRIELETETRPAAKPRSPSSKSSSAAAQRIDELVSDELEQVAADVRHAAPHPAHRGAAVDRDRTPPGPPAGRARGRGHPVPGPACRPPDASCASTSSRATRAVSTASSRRAPQQARRDPLAARHDESHGDRRRHEPRAPDPLLPGRPARRAGQLDPARRGRAIGDYLALADRTERILALVSLDSAASIALGTRQGVVKRVTAGDWANKPEFEIIALKPGDEVVGAVAGRRTPTNSSSSRATRSCSASPPSTVRPQGRAAGGMAGINLGRGCAGHLLPAITRRRARRRPSSSPSRPAPRRCPAPTRAAPR